MSRSRSSAVLVAALLSVVAIVVSACAPPPPQASDSTIADVLLADRSSDDANGFDTDWYDFDIVTQAVLLYPDLVEAASNPEAALTVFAPNDRAFQVLVYKLTGQVIWDEKGVFDAVASLGLPTVKDVLTYHLIGSKISAADALAVPAGTELTTLQGGKVGVEVANPALSLILLRDQDPNADDPGIVFSKFNVGGSLKNGYIHGISLVLRPGDLADVAA